MKGIYFSFFALSINIICAQDSPSLKDSIQKLDEVIIKANTILGNKFVAQNRTGASYFLSAEELGDRTTCSNPLLPLFNSQDLQT